MTIPEQHPIFVYGSLRPGEIFFNRVKPFIERIEPAELYGMQLYSLGEFPGLIWDAGAERPVKGDLFHIYKVLWPEAIKTLDHIEGEGLLYMRTQLIVMCGDEPRAAWTYLLRDLKGSISHMNKVESNDWKLERAQDADLGKTDSRIKPVSDFSLLGAAFGKPPTTKLL
jgi:gamma-glutamylcyclotransferase (GGCT)/AIG2-like uncharacterized protein YtfP